MDPRTFLAPHQECTTAQAVFRLARARIAVGTSSVEHLRELVAATSLDVDAHRIARYRDLVRAKAVTTGAR